ncbi:thioredoxin reductase-like selenoprotein T homolog CG3887 [Scaptodrosophila lebanonensis]|uniref:Thioredoxin reductase-like selenoprotein T homolog CG3887 n=1 Tax=Drosophila lebanonensis TaxID=7225 RepID=A0A6J2TPJ6_DROLE|nr:thioredoxin reductase-like selenoprotein T homolog CG3887 [Scaptodrosophila lebanonensis]
MDASSCKNLQRLCLYLFVGYALIIQAVAAEKEVPGTRFGESVGALTLNFHYCYSCGYQKAFDGYVNILRTKFPQIRIQGSNYQPPVINYQLAKLAFLIKIVSIAWVLWSSGLFTIVNTPIRWNRQQATKLYACVMIFFLGNAIEGHLIMTGAFEISLNDMPIWSKLQARRMPSPQELMQIIHNQLQFCDQPGNPNFVK